MEYGVAILDSAVPEEVPDQEFEYQPVGGVIRHSLLLVLPDLMVRIRGEKEREENVFVFCKVGVTARGGNRREATGHLFFQGGDKR